MEEGQAQGEEPVRRSQGGSIGVIGGGVDLLYNHDHVSPPDMPSPDQNQNRLMEDSEEVEQSPRGRRRQLKQDSVNNNGSCEEEEEEAEEDDSSKVEEDKEVEVEEEEEEEEGDSISGAFSSDLDSRIRDSPSYSPTGVEDLVSSPEECVLGGVEDHAEADALRGGWLPCSPPAAAVLELGEHCDHALLPQRLHQIAEALVLEEDYERAIRFIQLERLYHERLLANLAALQEQWECRWRGDGGAQSLTVERTPIDPEQLEQLERLSHICRTHRQPALRAEQSEAVDKVQKNSLICRSPRAEEEKEEEEEEKKEKEREGAVLLPCDTGSVADSARVTMEKKEKDAQETSPQHDSTAASTSLSQQGAPESSQSHPAPAPAPPPLPPLTFP
ncbi:consortin-like [Clupea harengus]|uniref:Consortin-like n=1 Tax=Clupea harengus TaxID=7950 RepID=A0A6P8GFG3_CLUHA|nr:consortin-like [Clupea harengus]XP_031435987.1 consortin-like [Clupea harengus]